MSTQTALIVDDSKLARITLQRLLEKRSFQVITAGSAVEALELLKQQPLPDIIFMDHLMPEIDGFEAMKQIKADPALSHIPVVMCTGKEGGDEYHAQARAIGAAATLSKPPETEQLNAVIAEAQAAIRPQESPASVSIEEPEDQFEVPVLEPIEDEIPMLTEEDWLSEELNLEPIAELPELSFPEAEELSIEMPEEETFSGDIPVENSFVDEVQEVHADPIDEQLQALQQQLTEEIEQLRLTLPRAEDIEARILGQIAPQPTNDPTELVNDLGNRLNLQLQHHEQNVQADISSLSSQIQALRNELASIAATPTAPDYADLESRVSNVAIAAAEDTLNVLMAHRTEQIQHSLQTALNPLRQRLDAVEQKAATVLSADDIRELAHQAVSEELKRASSKLIARITTALREQVDETQKALKARQDRFEQEIHERQDLFEQECSIQQHQMQGSRKNLLLMSGLSLVVSIGAVVAAVMM